VSIPATAHPHRPRDERSFLLQRAQPAMTGLINGSLSTLAPLGGAIIASVSAVLGAVG
jgi:hypothetical protein